MVATFTVLAEADVILRLDTVATLFVSLARLALRYAGVVGVAATRPKVVEAPFVDRALDVPPFHATAIKKMYRVSMLAA